MRSTPSRSTRWTERAELRSQAHRSFARPWNSSLAGLAVGEARLIGEGATLSSVANQAVLPKPQLAPAIDLAQAAGAVGVNVAHSGTVLGLLFAEDAERISWAAHQAWTRLPGLVAVHDCRVVGGGVVVSRGGPRLGQTSRH